MLVLVSVQFIWDNNEDVLDQAVSYAVETHKNTLLRCASHCSGLSVSISDVFHHWTDQRSLRGRLAQAVF